MKYHNFNQYLCIGSRASLCLLIAVILPSCGGSDDDSTTSLADAVPKLSITSPTLAKTSSAAVRSFAVDESTTITTPKTLVEKEADVVSLMSKTTVEECFQDFALKTYTPTVSCFGPSLAFLNHPGGAMSGPTPTDCPAGASCLPSGDLGIWEATESTGEACTAAKMNGLVEEVAAAVDNARSLAARVACVAQVNGVEMPGSDQATSLTDYLAGVWPDATFTQAELMKSGSESGMSVYQTTIDVTYQGARVYVVVQNSPLILTGGEQGRIYGFVDFLDGLTVLRRGFSVTYSRTNDDLVYALRSAITPTTLDENDFFDFDNGDFNYNYSHFLSGSGSSYRDARYILAKVSRKTGLGTVKFVWQAGSADKKARVFHVHTEAGTSKDTGFAYYGFGPKFGSTTDFGEIKGMCCNWAGPGAVCSTSESTYDQEGKGQSQYFERNTAGLFVIPASSGAKNNITYAPTNSCEYTNGGGTPFKYATISGWSTAETDHASVLSSGSDWLTTIASAAAGTIDWTTVTEPTFE